jgi:glycine cleavage system H protein
MADLKYPDDLRYTSSDEWLRVEGDTATVGITDYAQNALNDIVYVELPDVGSTWLANQAFGVVESVKAAADLKLPIDGEVIEVNAALEDGSEVINTDPYGKGWMVRVAIQNPSALEGLMDAAAYKQYCATRES